MTRLRRSRRTLALALVVVAAACDRRTPAEPNTTPTLDADLRAQLSRWGVIPIGEVVPASPAMIELGRALFFDPILSGNKDVSCATCHTMADHTGDALALSIGTGGTGQGAARVLGAGRQFVPRNAPTLLNIGIGLSSLFWDGRVGGTQQFVQGRGSRVVALPTGLVSPLAAQAMLPVLDRVEMRGVAGDAAVDGAPNELAAASDADPDAVWNGLMTRLLAIDGYKQRFGAAFAGTPLADLRFTHAANAMAAFESAELTRTNTPLDRYLAHDDGALTEQQKRGAMLFFTTARCSECHNGPMLGVQRFANSGVPQIGPGVGAAAPLDVGADWMNNGPVVGGVSMSFLFRVPPLRNVALTPPFMHDGAFATLDAVVRHYNNVQQSLKTYDPSALPPAVRAQYHGDAATIAAQLQTLDFALRTPLNLKETEIAQLVAFLNALTDPSAVDLRAVQPASVPSGLHER